MTAVLDIKEKSWSQENTPSVIAKSMFYYVQSAGHYFCNSKYFTERKNYNSMILIYTKKGKGYLHYRDNTYKLTKNKGFFINCMEPQIYGSSNESWEFIWLHFNGSESKSYFERFLDNNQTPIFSFPKNNVIDKNIIKISDMLKNREPQLDIKGSKLIVEMLTELLLYSRKQNSDQYKVPNIVKKALKEIEQNYYKSIKLDNIAEKINISKYYLSRLFKKHTGYSPHEYLINYRLTRAKDLLKTTSLPIYKIADKVGFNSSSHFIKIFKKETGTTPLKFRNYWI